MIQVSNAFKENIKKKVRQIGGFAELVVDGGYYLADRGTNSAFYVLSDDTAEITNLSSVADEDPTMYKYASLETNRTLLDGSFILANEMYTNKNTGFLGENLAGITSYEIALNDNQTSLGFLAQARNKKITFYFEEGYATDIDIEIEAMFSDTSIRTYTYSISDNNKKILTFEATDIPDVIENQGVQASFIVFNKITVDINHWSEPFRRARIRQMNIGETLLFENRDLIEINIDEQTSLDNTDVPSNECNILLNNYDRKFNLINKDSILNRIGKRTYIRPFIGVSIGGGIEYVDMGSYNYSSYTENQDKTITLYGSGSVETLSSENNYLWEKGFPDANMNTTLINMGIRDNDVGYNGVVPLEKTETASKREQLQALSIFSNSFIKESRDIDARLRGKLSLKKILPNSLLRIALSSQISEPKIVRKNKIKTVKIYNSQIGELDNTEKVLIDNYTGPVSDGRMAINITGSSPINVNSLKVYIGGVQIQEGREYFPGYVIFNSYYAPRIEISNLTNEENLVIKVVGKQYNQSTVETSITNSSIEEGETIEYNSNYLGSSYHKARIARNIFANERDYSFEVEFNGDPSLETGDTITFETVDGDMIGVIESINVKFNGGLKSTIKGVCNSVLQ